MNKEKYIKKVIRLLNCSQQQKKKIKLDLENDIEMALKNGESCEEIIQRMGTCLLYTSHLYMFHQELNFISLYSHILESRVKEWLSLKQL